MPTDHRPTPAPTRSTASPGTHEEQLASRAADAAAWLRASPVMRYAVSIVATAGALALRLILAPALGVEMVPFITLFATLVFIAWYAGLGPALLSLALGALGAAWFLLPPPGLAVRVPEHVWALVVYGFLGTICAYLGDFVYRAQRRAELSARRALDSESLLSLATDAAGLGIYDYDVVSRGVQADARVRALWGAAPDKALDYDTFMAGVHPDDRAGAQAALARVLDPGGDGHYAAQYRIVRRTTGQVRHVAATGWMFFRDGVAVRLVGTVQDVTERVEAEAARRASEEFTRRLADIAPSILYIYDLQGGRNVWGNREMTALLGYSADEITAMGGRLLETLIHPDDWPRYPGHRARLLALDDGEAAEFEYRMRHADGSWRWLHSRDMVFRRGPSGEPIEIVGAALDVTAHREAEASLRESQDRLLAFLDNPALMAWLKDEDGRYVFVSRNCERRLGIAPGAWLGKTDHDIWPREVADEFRRNDRAVLETNEQQEVVEHSVGPDGQVAHWLNHKFLLQERGRRYVGGLGIDITERKRAENALREADVRKDEFLAMLSHELRNPLAPIRNAVEVMRLLGPDEPRLRAARDIIERQVGHMTRLTDDLLDVSRITRGKVALRMERVPVRAVLETALEASRPLLDSAGHTLATTLGPEVWVLGDRARLVQIVTNLLTNAAKFTPPGGHVTLRAACADGRVTIAVQDTGIGIPKAAEQRIFDLFSQEEVSLDRTEGGLGIGLTLVKRLVEMHGGTVRVHSEGRGRGAEFVVTLPTTDAAVGAESPAASPAEHTAEALRILVVEDNEDAADAFRLLLELHGHRVRVARNGVDALSVFEEFPPDVAFIDLGLPGIDGYGVAERIRASAGRRPVLVALSGYGRDEDRDRARRAGFDAHMIKPVAHEDVETFLRAVAQPETAPAGGHAAPVATR